MCAQGVHYATTMCPNRLGVETIGQQCAHYAPTMRPQGAHQATTSRQAHLGQRCEHVGEGVAHTLSVLAQAEEAAQEQ